MTIELIPVTYKGHNIFGAVDIMSGEIILPITQFTAWVAFAKSVRSAGTRGRHAASLTNKEYAYRLKRWFDFISDWNDVATDDNKITWRTAQKKHMDFLSDKLAGGPAPLCVSTRNGLRWVWELFYEEFCPFMGYSHLMIGLSELIDNNSRHFRGSHDILGNRIPGRKLSRRSLGMEPEIDNHTFRVLSPKDISLLLSNFNDIVYSCLSYLMYATGLRIGGALQVPYPDTDRSNPFITSPILLIRDYGLTDNFFEYKYTNKGHEQVKDRDKCDVPIYAWQDIWNVYHNTQEERLLLWRKRMITMTGDNTFKKRYPASFWLKKDGSEVTASDVWQAYRHTRKGIQHHHKSSFPDATPHMLRHSYATWLVIDYSNKDSRSINPNNDDYVQFIHLYLQQQLGHASLSTTIKYIKTALRVVKRRWIPQVRLSSETSAFTNGQEASSSRIVDFEGLMKNLNKELAI